jgi:hypothetical protein
MLKFDFDLQLFNDEFAGIDEDIVKELLPEVPADTENNEDEKTGTQNDADASADADSDNKQVADDDEKTDDKPADDSETESDQPVNGQIPYSRFSDVNNKRKAAEAQVKSLQAELEKLKANAATVPNAETVSNGIPENYVPPQFTSGSEFLPEQLERITQMAMQRAAEKLNLDAEGLEALEYSDNAAQKMTYSKLVNDETEAIVKSIRAYKQREADDFREKQEVNKMFATLNDEFTALPDCAERWKHISEEAFSKLPPIKQRMLRGAFERLQQRSGNYQDFEVVSDYVNATSKAYDNQKANSTNNNTIKNKIAKAQELPKAPNISGSGNNDAVYTIDKIDAALKSPNGWDTLPENIKQQILAGELR